MRKIFLLTIVEIVTGFGSISSGGLIMPFYELNASHTETFQAITTDTNKVRWYLTEYDSVKIDTFLLIPYTEKK